MHSIAGLSFSYRRLILRSLVAISAFLIPWERTITVFGSLSLNAYVILLLFVLALPYIAIGGRLTLLSWPQVFLTGFVVWTALSLSWSTAQHETLEELTRWAGLWTLLLVYSSILKRESDVNCALNFAIAGGAVASLLVLMTVGMEVVIGTDPHRRIIGDQNPNWLVAPIAALLPLPLVRSIFRERKLAVPRATCLLFFVALVASGSRAALLVSSLSTIFILGWALKTGNSSQRMRVIKIIIVIAVGSGVALTSSYFLGLWGDRTGRIVRLLAQPTEVLNNLRVLIFKEYVVAVLERPLVGWGAGARESATDIDFSPHNAYLSVAVGLGIPGLTLFIAYIISGVRLALKSRTERGGAMALAVAQVNVALIFLTTANEHNKYLVLFVASAVIVSRSVNMGMNDRSVRLSWRTKTVRGDRPDARGQ